MTTLEDVLEWLQAYQHHPDGIYMPYGYLKHVRRLAREEIVEILEVEKAYLVKVKLKL